MVGVNLSTRGLVLPPRFLFLGEDPCVCLFRVPKRRLLYVTTAAASFIRLAGRCTSE